jgi:hypothetical protein
VPNLVIQIGNKNTQLRESRSWVFSIRMMDKFNHQGSTPSLRWLGWSEKENNPDPLALRHQVALVLLLSEKQ